MLRPNEVTSCTGEATYKGEQRQVSGAIA
jgi:hypothetical protein